MGRVYNKGGKAVLLCLFRQHKSALCLHRALSSKIKENSKSSKVSLHQSNTQMQTITFVYEFSGADLQDKFMVYLSVTNCLKYGPVPNTDFRGIFVFFRLFDFFLQFHCHLKFLYRHTRIQLIC